jgi:copper chaperone
METAVLKVRGMTCSGCVASVKRVLENIEGVKAVDVSLEREQATLQYDSALTGPARFNEAIQDAGYEVG